MTHTQKSEIKDVSTKSENMNKSLHTVEFVAKERTEQKEADRKWS